MNIEIVENAIRDFVVLALSGIILPSRIIWGDNHAPAPDEAYVSLFLTPTPTDGQDANYENADETAVTVGIREGRVDCRIFGKVGMNAAYTLERSVWVEERRAPLDAINAAIFNEGNPIDLTTVTGGRRSPVAGFDFSVRWIYSETVERFRIEEAEIKITTITGETDREFSVVT